MKLQQARVLPVIAVLFASVAAPVWANQVDKTQLICQDGGWNYSVYGQPETPFKNQGTCIQFYNSAERQQQGSADLTVTGASGAQQVVVSFTNNGPDAASYVLLKAQADGFVDITEYHYNPHLPNGWFFTTIAPGETKSLYLLWNSTAPLPPEVTVRASIVSTTPDPNPNNNFQTLTLTLH